MRKLNISSQIKGNRMSDTGIQDLKDIEFVYGPFTYHLLLSSSVCVILLGETHYPVPEVKDKGIVIDEYLNLLFKSQPKSFFDLFLERSVSVGINPKKQAGEYFDSGIVRVTNRFLDCMSSIRGRSDRCDNLRVHAIDARDMDDNSFLKYTDEVVTGQLLAFLYNRSGKDVFEVPFEIVDNLDYIYRNLKEGESLTHSDIVGKSIKDIDKSIPEFKIGYRLVSEMYEKEISSMAFIRGLGAVLKAIQKPITKDNYQQLFDKTLMLATELMVSMDIYALSRIMSKYSKYPHHAKNIVVYSGNAHTRAYLKFFQDIGLKLIYSQVSDKKDMRVEVPPIEKLQRVLKPFE